MTPQPAITMGQISPASLLAIFSILSIVLGAGAAFGAMKITQKFMNDDMVDVKADIKAIREEIPKLEEKFSKKLYKENGMPIYLTRDECKDCTRKAG